MMQPITNLVVNSISLVDGDTSIDFMFDKPAGVVGGYYLYVSSTGANYIYLAARVDASHQKELSISAQDDFYGKTHFYYTFDDVSYQGKFLYFYIIAVSTTLEVSVPSSVITTGTYPQKPVNLFCIYDNYEVDLSWDNLLTSSGRNSDFYNFAIYRNNLDEVFGTTMENNILYNSSFIEGKAVWVIDTFKKNQWFGEVTSTGALYLSSIKRTDYSSLTDLPFLDNFIIYIESDTDISVGTTTSTGYVDTAFVKGYHDIYKLKSVTSTGLSSDFIKFPVYFVDVPNTLPYLRSPLNSSTGLLSNPYWSALKNVLIDSKYYDKSLYAIPYSATESFNFKGFLGVSRCLVDVFIYDIYSFTTSTGIYGEFELDYQFTKGKTDIKIQARDKINVGFSRITGTYSIRTFNLYTWFSVLGNQYKQIVDELAAMKLDNSLSTVRYTSYVDRYKPLIELFKYANEDSAKFLILAKEIFNMFEYTSYDESLVVLLDALQEEADYFDHYEIFYRNSLYRTNKTGWDFVLADTSTGIIRENYYYGITSLTSTGEETDATIVRVDNRWWPVGYTGINVLRWSQINNVDYYNIYRGSSADSLEYLVTICDMFFIDSGTYTPNPAKVPPVHNFTDYEPPADAYLYLDTKLTPNAMLLSNRAWLQVVVYAEGTEDIPTYQLDRIVFYLNKIIAPEIRYLIIYANDTSVEFLS